MKSGFAAMLVLALTFSLAACGTAGSKQAESAPPAASEPTAVGTEKRVRFVAGENEIVVLLADNPAADSLYEMLPMELHFEDYNGAEKIAYPQGALTTEGAPNRCTPQRGDLCFYAPWGNLCFFYRDFRESPSLVPLGSVETGIEYLEKMDSVSSVTVETVR